MEERLLRLAKKKDLLVKKLREIEKCYVKMGT